MSKLSWYSCMKTTGTLPISSSKTSSIKWMIHIEMVGGLYLDGRFQFLIQSILTLSIFTVARRTLNPIEQLWDELKQTSKKIISPSTTNQSSPRNRFLTKTWRTSYNLSYRLTDYEKQWRAYTLLNTNNNELPRTCSEIKLRFLARKCRLKLIEWVNLWFFFKIVNPSRF